MKKIIIIFILILVVGIVVYLFLNDKSTRINSIPENANTPTPEDTITNHTATFNITSSGTVRTFTNPDYHNLSPDVYIEASNPNTINVKREGITWNDFFKTLPFSLSKDCLTTGTGQTFCTDENGTLRFFINDVEHPDALDLEINPNDRLQVIYE